MTSVRRFAALSLLASLLLPASALAALERLGPINPVHGFPEWFQDTTGVTFDLCVPTTVAELADGWCFAEPPNPAIPESYPSNWSVEHFWWSGEALGTYAGDRLLLVLAVESTFANDQVVNGDQVVFGRLRIRMDNVPVTGTYRFITPYGTFDIDGVAGDRIFATRDLGLTGCVPGDFSCALQSDIGPFLLPSNTPGGPELGPVVNPATGRLHIALPTRDGPVTGSPFGTNYFEVQGPVGAPPPVRINNFTLTGRYHEGALPARATVDRANYSRSAATGSIEAFATAFPSVPGRLPPDAPPAAVIPQLSFFPAPCSGGPDAEPPAPYGAPAGVTAVPMARNDELYHAKAGPLAPAAGVCIRYDNPTNGVGQPAAPVFFAAPLVDLVSVTEATYDAAAQTLTVSAASSDAFTQPELAVGNFGELTTPTPLDAGSVVLAGVTAPPAKVRVFSLQGGVGELQVATEAPPKPIPPPATGVTLAAALPSPQPVGTPVEFTAVGQGSSDYQYRFWLNDGTGWVIVQDYGTDATWVLDRPAGFYEVAVHVRTTADVFLDSQAIMTYRVGTAVPATGVLLDSNVPSPQPIGTAVTFTAQGQGSDGYEYRFWLNAGGIWGIVQDYGPSATWTMPLWLPAGTYQVAVHVRTSAAVFLDEQAIVNYVLQ